MLIVMLAMTTVMEGMVMINLDLHQVARLTENIVFNSCFCRRRRPLRHIFPSRLIYPSRHIYRCEQTTGGL